ncbi:MAG: histidine phosphatase family protein, partial [Gammaproteobacteria bacterium]
GEVEGGARYRGSSDDPLTAEGWAQMWAALPEDARWDRIVSSPLARCAGFARELSRRRSLLVEVNQGLREMHFGAWEGRTAADLAVIDGEALTRFWQDPLKYTPPGAETLAQLQSRTLGTLKGVITQYRHQHLLLITHGGPIRILLCQASGKPLEKSLQIEVQPASLHRLCGHVDADGTLQVRSRDPVTP